ncbi:MAG TPA: hypothetical protein PLO23_03205 [Alphaproteobacteria bacterium]|nr:hypothetical protein [Alphaproteobacteria bacterium]
MAVVGDPALANSESVYILRRLSPEVGRTISLEPELFTPQQGARLERAYTDKLHDFITNPRRGTFQASVEDINDLLMNDPKLAQLFARPWNNKLGISLEDAEKKGMVVPGSSPPQVRTFFQIDEGGYVYQTTPDGQRLTERGQMGSIYDGLESSHSFAMIARAAIVRKAERGLGDDTMKYITEMDGIFDEATRKKALGKDDVASPEASQEFYAKLFEMSDTELSEALAAKIAVAHPQQVFEPAEVPKDEKPEAAKKRQEEDAKRKEEIDRANADLSSKNLERETRYFNLIQIMGGLESSELRSVLDLVDMKRGSDVLLSGVVREGLGLGTAIGYKRSWGSDGEAYDMTQGRLWDMVGPIGNKVYGGMFTDGEPDLRIASNWKVSKKELIDGCSKDPGFQKVLEKMGLPDPIDNTDMQRISMGLYAYQVLKHEGKPGFEDRVAGIFSGKGLLDENERAVILAALRGDSPSAIVPNTQFDMPLFKHTYTHNRNADQDTASQSDAWFTKEFAGASGTTLTSEQAAQRFWNFESGYCKFPREFVRQQIDPKTIEAMKSIPGLEDVREGMKYEDLQGSQIKAYFEWRERMEPNTYPPGTAEKAAEYLKTIEQHHTAVEFWDNGRGKVDHAQIFASANRRQVMDAAGVSR